MNNVNVTYLLDSNGIYIKNSVKFPCAKFKLVDDIYIECCQENCFNICLPTAFIFLSLS
uniref:Uncharacterized protein n=1 Tax=Octopus bimaculoides TaxID=37653 RepID=A0A0L8GHR4_OCTBM